MLLKALRRQVVRVGLEALAAGIVHGTAGNMSLRDPASGLVAISPSGMPYPTVRPKDVAIVDLDGKTVAGRRKPSSETPLHTMVYRRHAGVGAIVHTHSHYSTVVSCIRDELPPILTEVCLAVGPRVPVTLYGLTGTADFGESVTEVMDEETRAVILRNHGLIAFGNDFAEALTVATIVEEAARVYVHALAAAGGQEPALVPDHLIPEMRDRFRATYGQRR